MAVDTQRRDAEHRLLTILVVDIVDSTPLARRLDQEDLAELLNAFHETSARVVNRFEGSVAKDLGDGFAAHFGWPDSHEHDAERAVFAGLELVEAVKSIPCRTAERIRIHIGIATGKVVVGDVKRGTSSHIHEAFGELPSLASRIQTISAPDSILVSAETYQLIRHKFVCVDVGRKRLKGFGQSIALYQVIGPRALSLNFDVRRAAGLTPLVGRMLELELLNSQWRAVGAGRDSVVLLSGEPGIGKSRLCAEFQSSLNEQKMSSFSFQCSPLHIHTPLYPITRSIAQIAGLSDADSPELKLEKLEVAFRDAGPARPEAIALLATHLGASKASSIGQELPIAEQLERRRRTLNALLINFLLAPAKRNPVLIVFEDIHWMDPTTAEFVEMLIDRIRGQPILVIFTFRPQFSPDWKNARLVTLDRLTRDQTIQFIHVFASSPLPDDLVLQLVERSDGNPLYIEELTAAVLGGHRIERARAPHEEDKSRSDIPSTLQESLLSRIDRTSPQARELIQICAVLGRRFSHRQISAVAEIKDEELETTLAELVGEGLLYTTVDSTDVDYCFKHALIQATAYSLILREKRRRLHSKCAVALETHFPAICKQDPGVIGLHYENANNAQAAMPYVFAAAKSAIDRSALLEATTYLQRGLALLEKLPDSESRDKHELAFRSALGRVCIFGKGWAHPSVKEQYERALLLAKQVGSKKERIPLEWALTTYHLLRGEVNKAVSGGRRVLGLAEHANDDDFLLVAHSAMSIYEFYSGNFLGSVGHKESALRFYREKTSEELQKAYGTDRRLQALRGAALSHWCIGNHQLAIELDEEQRSRATRHPFDYTYSLTISCILHSLSRNSQMMRSFSETAITIAQDQGFGFLEANAANFRAIALTLQNPADSTLREFDEAIEKYQIAGNQMGISSMLAIIAEHCGKIGFAERGLMYIDRALDYVRRSGEQFAQSDIYRVKGILLAALNRTGEAQRCLARALMIAQKQKAKTWELGAAVPLAQILCDKGEFKKSRKLLEPLCHVFEGSKFVSEELVQAHTLTTQCRSRDVR